MNLTREKFPLGWIPSDDAINGRAEGLLRMDNLTLDDIGSITLCNGVRNVSNNSFPYILTTLYSKTIDNKKYRFVGLANGDMYYDVDNSGNYSLLFSGGAFRASYANGFGHIFFFSGNERKKFDGTNLTNISPLPPENPPQVQEAAKPDYMFLSNDTSQFSLVTGSDFVADADKIEFKTDGTSGVIHRVMSPGQNSMNMSNGESGTIYDSFHIWIYADVPENITAVKVLVYLSPTIDPLTDYYSYTWRGAESLNLNAGKETWSELVCLRKDFEKSGNEENTGWENIYGVRLIIETSAITTIRLIPNGMLFSGAIGNQLNGIYEYIQVNVNNTGHYLAKSVRSETSVPVHLINGRALITPTPSTDPQVNEYWIYRRDATWRSDVIPRGGVRKLDRFYRVAVRTDTTPFEDGVSDDDAILEGVVYNEGLERIDGYIDGTILMSTSTPWNNRFVYITEKEVLFSDEYDPGLYSPFWNIKLSGKNTERNLWIKATSINQILVGTTEDIYEISGTGTLLPDNTLDIRVTPAGVGFPPLSRDVALYEGGVFYVARDGVRYFSNGSYKKISTEIDPLFYNKTVHGVPPIRIVGNDYGTYSIAISRNKLYLACENTDSSRCVYIYDLKYQYWTRWTVSPYSVYAEDDGNVLFTFSDVYWTDFRVRELTTGYTIDGFNTTNNPQYVELRTVFDHNGQPRNRKDVFTLKISADTGGYPLNVYLAVDGGDYTQLGTINSNGYKEFFFTLNGVVPNGFAYSLKITGYTKFFKFYRYTIEYNPFPEQLTYFHLGATNLGTQARKRLISFPIVIDPLGNNVSLTPIIDGNSKTTEQFNYNRKLTHTYYFVDDSTGVDFDFTLSGGPFEFYELSTNEIVYEKLPPATRYYILPTTDFGSPDLKRVRTIPFVLNPMNSTVTYYPKIDGVTYASTTFSGSEKATFFHYFNFDAIGIDYGGTLVGSGPFEFYGIGTPEIVERFPVYKVYDQVGPVDVVKLGRIIGFRVRLYVRETSIAYSIYAEDVVIQTGVIHTVANVADVYEIPYLPKTLKGTVIRIVLGPTTYPFHRYWAQVKANVSGNDTEISYINI